MQWQISKNYEIVCVLGLSRGRVVRGYPSKNAGAGIPGLVPGPVPVPAQDPIVSQMSRQMLILLHFKHILIELTWYLHV